PWARAVGCDLVPRLLRGLGGHRQRPAGEEAGQRTLEIGGDSSKRLAGPRRRGPGRRAVRLRGCGGGGRRPPGE
ncbi:unnamed protein product, partial [Effrenium voratum]